MGQRDFTIEETDADDKRRSASFLVRVWLEPRVIADEPSPMRGYLRNLQTGEEEYFADPSQIEEHVRRYLREGLSGEPSLDNVSECQA
ncbi:MAG: hypothetical protein MAG451_00851 [Anaerolineales bacterium]|nr:hypothetical protein [Anaerolineales bacterium]